MSVPGTIRLSADMQTMVMPYFLKLKSRKKNTMPQAMRSPDFALARRPMSGLRNMWLRIFAII